VFSPAAIIEKLKQYSVAISVGFSLSIKEKDKTATLIRIEKAKHTIESFLDFYELTPTKAGFITLYKSVNPKTNCDFYTGKIKYKGTVGCPDWNPDENIQCGNGLHLSATPEDALRYNKGKIIKCRVNIKDIVFYPYDISKVRCKEVKVLKEK